jgi:hypothetical protein
MLPTLPAKLMALSAKTSQQALPTEDMCNNANQLLDYMATHPDAKNTILHFQHGTQCAL